MVRRILIADDSLMARLQVRRYLELLGLGAAAISFAGDGAQALEVCEEHGSPDLFITDLNMPVMDGFELLRALNDGHIPPPGRIIVVTSAVGPQLIAALAPYRVGTVIEKPLSLGALGDACRDLGILPAGEGQAAANPPTA